MIVLQGATALGKGLETSFLASGGVEPYTYEVVAGGAGGTIDSDGYYTAPQNYGVDIIRVTDSDTVPVVIEKKIGIMGYLELICNIIQQEMGLDDNQVYIYNQKFTIPKDSKLYIAVGILSSKPFGNTNRKMSEGSDLLEDQSINVMNTVSIDIMSRGPDALYRKEEVIMALNSMYAQNQQTANSFHVAKIPVGFTNLSDEDGAAIPFRFNISVNVQYAIKKNKAVRYYDTISTELETNE